MVALATLELPAARSAKEAPAPAEPFGLETSPLHRGGLRAKWRSVERKLKREAKVLARCRADRATCPEAARKFLAVIERAETREGRARIGEINRSINLLIRWVDDQTQYGVADLWASPLVTFASGAGDCEDYAIAKYVALREVGFAPEDLRLVVVRDQAAREYHAVAAVRLEGRWLILDNRDLALRADVEMTQLQPLFVIDADGVKRLLPAKHEFARAAAALMAAVGAAGPATSWMLL